MLFILDDEKYFSLSDEHMPKNLTKSAEILFKYKQEVSCHYVVPSKIEINLTVFGTIYQKISFGW